MSGRMYMYPLPPFKVCWLDLGGATVAGATAGLT